MLTRLKNTDINTNSSQMIVIRLNLHKFAEPLLIKVSGYATGLPCCIVVHYVVEKI